MRRLFQNQMVTMGAIVACFGLAIGVVIAVVAIPGSLTNRNQSYSPPPAATATPTPAPSATPVALKPGTLSAGLTLVAAGTKLIAIDSAGARQSSDQGLTWSAPNQPKGATGVLVDRGDPNFRLAGGPTLLETTDGGANWKAPKAQPPGAAPFTPLMVNPGDSTVWFVVGNGHLLRTRDGGVTWRALTGLPTVTSARMAAMAGADQFILAIGGQVFELLDNGNQVKALPVLPSGGAARLAVVGSGDPPPIVVVTDSGHAYSFRAGAWADVVTIPAGPLDGLPSGKAFLGDGGTKVNSPGWVLVTADGGVTWKPATGLPGDQPIDAITSLGPAGNSVWAYAAAGDIYHSADGGISWSLVSHAFRSS
jgi:photosystem II stability/assembly factor-like uncharacterized protein